MYHQDVEEKFEKTLWVLQYETLKKKYPECFGKKTGRWYDGFIAEARRREREREGASATKDGSYSAVCHLLDRGYSGHLDGFEIYNQIS